MGIMDEQANAAGDVEGPTFYVTVKAETLSGRPVDRAVAEKARGRLAVWQPKLIFEPEDGPGICVTLASDAAGPADAMEALGVVLTTFGALDENLVFLSVSIYAAVEYDRLHLAAVDW